MTNDVRKEWTKLVSFDTREVDKRDKFPSLLKFLLNCKKAIEYDSSNLRSNTSYAGRTINLTASEKLGEDGHEDESNTEQQKETNIPISHEGDQYPIHVTFTFPRRLKRELTCSRTSQRVGHA